MIETPADARTTADGTTADGTTADGTTTDGTTTAPVHSRPRRRAAETRARLVEAAKAVFEEKGFHETRIADIAERAAVSHGSFYHYFDSKEDVFREIAAAVDSALSAGMDIILDRDSTTPPRERLTAAIRVHFEAYRKEARILGVIEQVARHDPHIHRMWTQLYLAHNREVAVSIAQLQQHGLADPQLDPTVAAAALGAMTWRFADQWLVQGYPSCDFDTGLDQLTTLFVNALRLADPDAAQPRPRHRAADDRSASPTQGHVSSPPARTPLHLDHVEYRTDDQIAVITLNRPEAAHAQSPKVLQELDAAWRAADQDPQVKVIVLASDGQHFSAGHDISGSSDGDAPTTWTDSGDDGETRGYLHYAKSWRQIPKPSIAAVQGTCIAAGLMLCWPCDLIIAADNAEFSDPVLLLGIAGAEFHAHACEFGPRKAKELLFTGEAITAQEAHGLGLVNRVVPLDDLLPTTLTLARRIARQDGFALRMAKRAVNHSLDVQGFSTAIDSVFGLHHLGHARAALMTGGHPVLGGPDTLKRGRGKQSPGERCDAGGDHRVTPA